MPFLQNSISATSKRASEWGLVVAKARWLATRACISEGFPTANPVPYRKSLTALSAQPTKALAKGLWLILRLKKTTSPNRDTICDPISILSLIEQQVI